MKKNKIRVVEVYERKNQDGVIDILVWDGFHYSEHYSIVGGYAHCFGDVEDVFEGKFDEYLVFDKEFDHDNSEMIAQFDGKSLRIWYDVLKNDGRMYLGLTKK